MVQKTKEARDVNETKTKEETMAQKKETTQSGRYLKMWHESKEGKFRPTRHQFEVVDSKFEIEIEKNNKMDTTKINVTYQGKEGPMQFSIGAYTKSLGKVWVGAPESVNAKQNNVEVH